MENKFILELFHAMFAHVFISKTLISCVVFVLFFVSCDTLYHELPPAFYTFDSLKIKWQLEHALYESIQGYK